MASFEESSTLEKSLGFVAICVLELSTFIGLVMEPFFKWLPILGLLYVLVPYYNQVLMRKSHFCVKFPANIFLFFSRQFANDADFDAEDDEFGDGDPEDYNAWMFDERRKRSILL